MTLLLGFGLLIGGLYVWHKFQQRLVTNPSDPNSPDYNGLWDTSPVD